MRSKREAPLGLQPLDLVGEAVLDEARRAEEGGDDLGLGLVGGDDEALVALVVLALLGGQEARADVAQLRAERERARERRAVDDAARAQHRQVDRRGDRGHEHERVHGPVADVARRPRSRWRSRRRRPRPSRCARGGRSRRRGSAASRCRGSRRSCRTCADGRRRWSARSAATRTLGSRSRSSRIARSTSGASGCSCAIRTLIASGLSVSETARRMPLRTCSTTSATCSSTPVLLATPLLEHERRLGERAERAGLGDGGGEAGERDRSDATHPGLHERVLDADALRERRRERHLATVPNKW